MTAALLVIPGVAHADTTTTPALPDLGSLTQQGEGISQDVKDAVTGLLPSLTPPALPTGSSSPSATPTAGAVPTLTPPDLGPLQTLFDTLGVPAACTTAVTGDLVEVVGSIPATVQAIVAQLQTGLEAVQQDPTSLPTVLQSQIMTLLGGIGGTPGADADADGVPLITAVEDLITDFLANCLPSTAAGSSAPTSIAPAAQTSSAPVAAPVSTPQASPVAYLGYAPTGVDTDDSGSSATALLALGGVLLLAGGVAGTWIRLRRGVPFRG